MLLDMMGLEECNPHHSCKFTGVRFNDEIIQNLTLTEEWFISFLIQVNQIISVRVLLDFWQKPEQEIQGYFLYNHIRTSMSQQ